MYCECYNAYRIDKTDVYYKLGIILRIIQQESNSTNVPKLKLIYLIYFINLYLKIYLCISIFSIFRTNVQFIALQQTFIIHS